MNITYIFLAINILSLFLINNRKILSFLLVIAVILGFQQNILNLWGVGHLALFALISQRYFYHQNRQSPWKYFFFVILIFLIARFRSHLTPGITNLLVIKNINLTPISKIFSMYLNFDKIVPGLIIYLFGNFSLAPFSLNREQLKKTIQFYGMVVAIILLPAYLSNYIKFDPKIPQIFWLWSLNNLLFVSVIEEIVFRGFLQNQLKKLFFAKYNTHCSVILSSIIFGLDHYSSGIIFVILAMISGLFYGYVYEKTGNLLSSIIVHFGLNLTHLLVFTYPAFHYIK